MVELHDAIWTIIRDLQRVTLLQRRAATETDLGPIGLGVLNLAAQSPITPSEAAHELHVPPQSITRAVADLTDHGLVTRLRHSGDGRSYSIDVTKDGQKARDRFRGELTRGFAIHLSDWTDEEVSVFAGQLTRLTSSLTAETNRPSSS
ncbi:MarR family winged helix-turn-helix transcriptional regulator [Brevibacterium oceani]|uniref:MarR family winged helix-turn-helix transcriptional regulator n=1 Tax=Brevibacterium oceani TaxID=358099 RepID=UPI001B329B61|nr:MarR family transcriptional regulator [Brevibacterium oceani]